MGAKMWLQKDTIMSICCDNDYEASAARVKDPRLIEQIECTFPSYNPRIILASILIYKFPSEFNIQQDNALFEAATSMYDSLLTHIGTDICHEESFGSVYYTFFRCFIEWRAKDIEEMRQDIVSMKETFESISKPIPVHSMDDDDSNKANKQWQDGINSSINLMNRYCDTLDTLSRSPPSS